MDNKEVFQHWSDWAKTYGAGLRATTKASTAKLLELDALERRIRSLFGDGAAEVLEAGCGNGVNCLHLARVFENLVIDGFDYVPEMIEAANEVLGTSDDAAGRLSFYQGDVTKVGDLEHLKDAYDLVFTNRCLINLGSTDSQIKAIGALASKLRPGGHLIMIENSTTPYAQQNRCREHLGLEARKPAEFNHFFQEDPIVESLAHAGLELIDTEDFSSLHDLVLYALVPAVNGGEVDYDHPMVQAAALLSKSVSGDLPGAFGPFGQNRLFHCRKLG